MFQWLPTANLLYACDGPWWDVYHKEVQENFKGECYAYDPDAGKYGIRIVKADTQGVGLGRNGVIHTGGNSGFQVINLLYFLKAKKMILLGYDMKRQGDQSHCHGNHPGSLNRHSDYNVFVDRMKPLARDLKNEGIKVINATRSTALDCFDKQPLEQALC